MSNWANGAGDGHSPAKTSGAEQIPTSGELKPVLGVQPHPAPARPVSIVKTRITATESVEAAQQTLGRLLQADPDWLAWQQATGAEEARLRAALEQNGTFVALAMIEDALAVLRGERTLPLPLAPHFGPLAHERQPRLSAPQPTSPDHAVVLKPAKATIAPPTVQPVPSVAASSANATPSGAELDTVIARIRAIARVPAVSPAPRPAPQFLDRALPLPPPPAAIRNVMPVSTSEPSAPQTSAVMQSPRVAETEIVRAQQSVAPVASAPATPAPARASAGPDAAAARSRVDALEARIETELFGKPRANEPATQSAAHEFSAPDLDVAESVVEIVTPSAARRATGPSTAHPPANAAFRISQSVVRSEQVDVEEASVFIVDPPAHGQPAPAKLPLSVPTISRTPTAARERLQSLPVVRSDGTTVHLKGVPRSTNRFLRALDGDPVTGPPRRD